MGSLRRVFIQRLLTSAVALAAAVGCSGDSSQNGSVGALDQVDEIRISMTKEDVEALFTRDPFNDDRLPATAVLPGMSEPVETDGVRFRGSNSRTYPRKSINLRLTEPNAFVFGNERRDAGRHLNLNAMWTDPTGMREYLAFKIYRELGVPAPETRHTDVYFNDVLEGLHIAIERIDQDFLDNNDLESRKGRFLLVRDETVDSNRVNARSIFGVDVDSVLGGSDEELIASLQELFDNRGNEENQDWSPLLELVRWVYRTEPGPAFEAGIRERFDFENLRDFFAMHALLQDMDSMDGDYWLHRSADAGAKWRVIPWDKNLTFGTNYNNVGATGAHQYLEYDVGFFSPHGNELFNKALRTPGLRREVNERIRELIQTKLSPEAIRAEVEAARPLVEPRLERKPGAHAFVHTPQQHHGALGFASDHFDALVAFTELRGEFLLSRIDGASAGVREFAVEKRLESVNAKTRVHFTDRNGWVIATFEPDSRIGDATVSVRVEETAGVNGVNRTWTVDPGGASLSGELTLYYRNSPTETWTTEANAVGRERELVVVDVTNGAESLLSTVNPYINRVTARISIDRESLFQLRYGGS